MKYCSKCGAQIADEALKFCSQCGAPMQAGADQPAPASPTPAPASSSSGMQDNVAGLLSYILGFITGIIFLVIEPYNQRPFVRFHAYQSIFFSAAYIGIQIILSILTVVLIMSGAPVGSLLTLISTLFFIAVFVLWIICIVKAYQNSKFMIPVIGQMAENQANKK